MANVGTRSSMSTTNTAYTAFRHFLCDSCGILLGDGKEYLIDTRIRKILKEYDLSGLSELVERVNRPGELSLRQQVIDSMTTNETFWFRDGYPFHYLANTVFPELDEPNKKVTLRVWSAACSSGQEPYSISMLIEEFRSKSRASLDAQILATDLSSSILDSARSAQYDKLALIRGLTQDRTTNFFDKIGDDTWQVKPEIRSRVNFRSLNLQESMASLGKFDIVFCRNVLIYFSPELKVQILRKIHSTMRKGGLLFLGASEGLSNMNDLYEMVRCEPGVAYRTL